MAQQLKIPWQYASYGAGQRPYQPPPERAGMLQLRTAPRDNWQMSTRERDGDFLTTEAPTRSRPPSERCLASGKRPRPPANLASMDTSEGSCKSGDHVTSGGSHVPSSTPHAPRKKRSVLELLPHGRETSSLVLLPSSHDLLKRHTYIDSGKLKTVLKESNVVNDETKRDNRDRKKKEKKKTAVARKQAWQDKHSESQDEEEKQVKRVQPFRRTISAAPPDGVPLLDLSKLNEPDHAMKPVELVSIEWNGDNDSDMSARSCMSWGVSFTRSNDDIKQQQQEEEEEEKRESERTLFEKSLEEEEGEKASGGGERLMDVAQAKFVEEKVLSHERAISSLSPHAPPSLHPPGHTHSPHRLGHAHNNALMSHLTFGLGISESGLSRRLQFEARVLTHNGRDMHRELCGFFFLSDSSITVYEFRKFGRKSSALPLVQRKVYCHQLGHQRGEPYQINFIRKGFTLQFLTSVLPALPDYMASQSILSLRVTQCSEREKRQLLCVNQKPSDCLSIDSFLYSPLSPAEHRAWSDLRVLQKSICYQILGRASKTLVGLGRYLTSHTHSALSVGKELMKGALHAYHIFISNQDFRQLWKLLISLSEFGDGVECNGGGSEGVRMDRAVAGLVGEMSEERKSIIRKVFQKLDSNKNGTVTLTNVRRFYRHDTSKLEGVWFDHTHKTSLHTAMATIDYADFENYYEGVSIETEQDSEFMSGLRRGWAL